MCGEVTLPQGGSIPEGSAGGTGGGAPPPLTRGEGGETGCRCPGRGEMNS